MIDELSGTIAAELQKPIIARPISTVIHLIEWTPADGVMRVTFTSGRVYDHPGVSREQVQAFVDAPSAGQHWNTHFKQQR
jgi:hypothetical protein